MTIQFLGTDVEEADIERLAQLFQEAIPVDEDGNRPSCVAVCLAAAAVISNGAKSGQPPDSHRCTLIDAIMNAAKYMATDGRIGDALTRKRVTQ